MADTTWNPELYDRKHAFVFEYGKDLLALLDPRPAEAILDLGCGTGHLARAIADAGARVTGIDRSATMIETARAAYPDLEFHVADARNFAFPSPFDAVFSNATLHWVTEPEKAVRCIAASLKPGGRFVAEFGGRGNVAQITSAVIHSLGELLHLRVEHGWYFPTIGQYATLLEQNGLAVSAALLFDRPTTLEDGKKGLRTWLTMFAGHLFADVPAELKEHALEKIEEQLRPLLFREGQWYADYRRIRVVASKE